MISCVRTGEGEKAGFNANWTATKVLAQGKWPRIWLRVAICYIVAQYTKMHNTIVTHLILMFLERLTG